MKTAFFAAASLIALRAFGETTEVVYCNGGVRVNKSDFEADQEKDVEARVWKLDAKTKQEEVEQPQEPGAPTAPPPNALPNPAPSAPNFNGTTDVAPPPVDPATGAVLPVAPSPNQLLVAKEGKKYFVIDAQGNHVEGKAGIEDGGYTSEEAARKAINELPR